MQMPDRSHIATGSGYRFGFNNMEKDDELKGPGNSYDFGARLYDPRIGRWLAVDPLAGKYPGLSPYAFVANSPLIFIDPDGKDIVIIGSEQYQNQVTQTLYNLATTSPTGAQLVKDAIASGKTLVIMSTNNDTEIALEGLKAQDYQVLYFNFQQACIPYDAKDGHWGNPLETTPEITLAHEIAHFLDDNKEMLHVDGKSFRANEVHAVEVENIVRKEMGFKERTHYDGVLVYGKGIAKRENQIGYSLVDKENYAQISNKTLREIDFSKVQLKMEDRKRYTIGGARAESRRGVSSGLSNQQTRIYEEKK